MAKRTDWADNTRNHNVKDEDEMKTKEESSRGTTAASSNGSNNSWYGAEPKVRKKIDTTSGILEL